MLEVQFLKNSINVTADISPKRARRQTVHPDKEISETFK